VLDRWGLFADYYELTMAASFFEEGRDEPATFELFVRRLPPERDFLVVCGIQTALDRLEQFTYGRDELAYLRSLGTFDEAFLSYLATFRCRAAVRAMAEGELAFAGEPLLSLTAPLIEAQLVETLLLNTVGYETMIATKAARVAMAARGRSFVDFSARRDHGADAAILAARATAVGGAAATSMVEAGRRYGLPLSGTMAHSYVMAHDTEHAAFTAFLHRYREASVLLVDTYDTLAGTRAAVDAMAETGIVARGIRIDSGDLSALATDARRILDDAGLSSVQVLVSGDLDEHRVAELVTAGAPIDAFGVGTRMGTSSDAPYLGVVYKLVEQGGEPRSKSSPDKATLPGRKQVWRGPDGDTLALASEAGPPDARPLLELVWHDGRRLGPPGDLGAAGDRCAAALAAWTGVPPAVEVSAGLLALAREPAARGRGASRT
jgi:nicotinate phosphoribosyltransferase